MINIVCLFLFPVSLIATQLDNRTVFAKLGDTIYISCFYHSQMAMHFSWYKHELGQNPRLILTIYKYDQKATFYHNFRDSSRFSTLSGKGLYQLVIRNLQFSDSAIYYCGSSYSNVLEFIQGTELIVQDVYNYTAIQQHALHPFDLGELVSLQCTVLNQSCLGNHSVYWLIHTLEPRIIKVHGISNAQCEWSSEAGYRERKCVYSLSKKDLRISKSGTHYCAVFACGEILFGNSTRPLLTGDDSTELISTIVLLSIVRTLLFLIGIATITLWYCMHSKRIARASFSPQWQDL
ncbi:immunoglobulin kappa light chain-like [Misgurnus anguillicaudatus]|uniref:immunoglobulin kappa light chain-like n=1 Tax=Misgurnus anguillicaudatus TaxID=75329 RepID=UPI002434E04D|nr:immunoglobulin kappa light chain-like [Misgurnus anguillicaudatus]